MTLNRGKRYSFISLPLLIGLIAGTAHAKGENAETEPKVHEIQPGETLLGIAISYGITMKDLMETNAIENPDRILFGQKLILPVDPRWGRLTKAGVVLEVPGGFTLTRIASLYGTSVREIIRANKLLNPDRIREGQTLLIPGAKRVVELVPPPPCFKDPVTLYRIRTDETLELPLELCNGKINVEGMKMVSKLTNSVSKPTDFDLHPRLIMLMQKVAEHYPGKRIEVVSGQRRKRQKGNESYHNKGQALDFRVSGVSNRALTQYLRSLDKVGVGYYPNSVFVHMDVREKSAFWIDYSGPGEKAIYGRRGMTKKEIEAIREKRRRKVNTQKTQDLSTEAKVSKKSAKKES